MSERKADAELDGLMRGVNRTALSAKFRKDCADAIRAIAAGHNDPRGLAQSILAEFEGDQPQRGE